jgi:hypothetical protein
MKRPTLATTQAAAVLIACALLAPSAMAAPPAIDTGFSGVGTEGATLKATIKTEGKATEYRFEYGLADCASSSCTPTPVPDGKIQKEDSPKSVEAKVEGLTPGATYHFRVVARNGKAPADQTAGADTVFTTHAPPPVFGPCANDPFRIPPFLLPDCRAYEQASPVQKNGLDALGRVAWAKASPQGDRISFLTTSGIPGADGSQELPAYLAGREAGGWSSETMLPPASAGSDAETLAWTPDFSRVYQYVRRLSSPTTSGLFARSSADGSLTPIVDFGPELNGGELAVAAMTPDGSIVLFETETKLGAVPAALEGKPNLYLWDRESGSLHLGGVMNDGTAPPQGAFAGAYDWIDRPSDSERLSRGGASANHYTQDEHVLSGDGEALYFTAAGSGRLYMRRNPTEPQSAVVIDEGKEKCTEPAKACTIEISASQKKNGGGPGGTDSAGAQPAALMQASPDGSKVLFTSPEKLTDDATTGPEPAPPAIVRSDLEGENEDMGCVPATSRGVAVDAAHIYWTDPRKDTIGRADLDCGDPEPEFITGANSPQYVAVDGAHIYWTNAENEAGEEGKGLPGEDLGSIGRAKLGTTEADEIEQDYVDEGVLKPRGIAVDSEHVYWSNAGNELDTRTIGRAKLGAGEAEEVEGGFIGVDFGLQRHTPQGLSVNAAHIYVATDSAGGIGTKFIWLFRFDIDGDPSSRVSFVDGVRPDELPGVSGVALDANFVYWARQGLDSIGRIDLDLEAAGAEREFVKEAGAPQGLAVDAGHLYWSANGELLPNPGNDLYLYDAEADELTDLTVDGGDEDGAEVQGVLGASEDAGSVYFAANGDLDGSGPATAGDCKGFARPNGLADFTGQCSLYLARQGEPIRFIARFDLSGGTLGSDAVNWTPHVVDRQLDKTARVSPDGRFLLFRSRSRLTAYENHGVPQLYHYDAAEDEIDCVSCNPSGEVPGQAPTLGTVNLSTITPGDPASRLSRTFSAEGTRVFFESTDPLLGTDVNGAGGCPEVGTSQITFPACRDVYEWEAQGTGSCQTATVEGGCLYLLSTGTSASPSFFLDASTSGEDAFLVTRTPLVGQDQDQLYDVYDAGVGGGLASQHPPPEAICAAEACKPGITPAPEATSPGSALFRGAADPTPKPRKAGCPKAKRRHAPKGKRRCGGRRGRGHQSAVHHDRRSPR